MWLISITHTSTFAYFPLDPWTALTSASASWSNTVMQQHTVQFPSVTKCKENGTECWFAMHSSLLRSCVPGKPVCTLGGGIGRLWQEKWNRSAGCVSGWWSWCTSMKYLHAVQLPPATAVKCHLFLKKKKKNQVCDLIKHIICKLSMPSLVISLLLNRIEI